LPSSAANFPLGVVAIGGGLALAFEQVSGPNGACVVDEEGSPALKLESMTKSELEPNIEPDPLRHAALDAVSGALESANTVKEIVSSSATSRKAVEDALAASSASRQALEEILASPVAKTLQDAINQLNQLPKFDIEVPNSIYDPALLLPADERTVSMLKKVHAELEGLGRLLNEGARQTASVVEVTKANLTALQTVVGELEKSRVSSNRSSTALFWLTVALFATGAVVALAAAPQFVNEIKAAWGFVQSIH
jgi:hypothetical protein